MPAALRSPHVIEALSKLVSVRGAPRYLRSDNGPEFVSRAVLQWLNESFNGKFRDECLEMQWIKNRIDARVAIEGWRKTFNEVRPHSSLNNLTPLAYAK